ncbi:MAG TPA: ATP-dependent Clp protease adaptor ClpS [Prolixibacteraceae bacterium]|nr:ATP-dependent Clp protease adaptor ClpS [Prolixibacteraceae bacterium]
MKKEIYKEKTTIKQKSHLQNERELILINDDHHTFDYVIDALIDVCNHTTEQATQCAMITHYKGQCEIKKGQFNVLRLMRKALTDRELRVKIN